MGRRTQWRPARSLSSAAAFRANLSFDRSSSTRSTAPTGPSSSKPTASPLSRSFAALKAAHARGVDFEAIVDKTSARVSKSGSRCSAATYLSNAGIPVWVDTRVAIAHNKVKVIDGAMVITGSFNFTAAAHSHNAENLLVIRDVALASPENWERRRGVSVAHVRGWL
jgi:PLD-like domain